MPVEAE
jgi:hypothetical protein